MSNTISNNAPITNPRMYRFGEMESDNKINADKDDTQCFGPDGLDWDVFMENRDAFRLVSPPGWQKQLDASEHVKDIRDSYTTVNINGKDYYLYNSDYDKYLNDPDVTIDEYGIKRTTQTGQSSWKIELLGEAVDKPQYVPPKYTNVFFTGSASFITSHDSIDRAEKELRVNSLYGIDGFSSNSLTSHNIDSFAKSMLDFFSMSKATQDDIDSAKTSIENIIKELAEMLRNGEEPDLNKVKGKVNIMGEQVTITQILDMQKYGKELSNQLVNADKEGMSLNSERVGAFAKRGLIKSIGMSYGEQIGGVVGEMFKSAWEAEVDRHSQIKMGELDSSAGSVRDEKYNSFVETLKNGAEWMYDVFSKIDTSSKENALKSFKNLSYDIDNAIRKFLDQYTGTGGLEAKMRSEIDSYFNDLMGFKNVNTYV